DLIHPGRQVEYRADPDNADQFGRRARRESVLAYICATRVPSSGDCRSSMNILYITAGAAGMYCGSCLRDNALATELIRQGHDVTLLPLYTPTLTDEPNVSSAKTFFGGISVYLEQRSSLFRYTPRW